jgi:dienelactone hydrolase
MAKLSRRELGMAALGGATLIGAQALVKYTGALDGLESKVDLKAFDPVYWTVKRHDAAPLRLTFHATTRKEAEAWQRKLRAKLIELVGGFPAARGPVRCETLEVREFPKYRREKFWFESRPGVALLGYLLTPAKSAPPLPAVVCVPGHGRGVDDCVGIDEQGRDRTERVPYAFDFAIQVAEHGMAAVAIEPMAFGCRRDAVTKKKGLGTSACQPAAGSALLFGETMIGWRVYDVMRTIDWIETRKELDAKRVGCTGISGGGTCTLFSSALEPRIRAALVSCYLNTFRDSIMSLSHCIDNYVPGILNWAEMYDLAGLIAPRPLFAESGDKDPIFPIAASRASFERVRKIYEVFGAAELTGHEVFEGGHQFSGKLGLPFLARHLAA